MEDVSPINVLIEELKSDEITLRLNAVKRLSVIAVALGPERTRQELIPFLADSVDDEDEVLMAMAEELGAFVPYVGGPAHGHTILPPLEALCHIEETVVRDKAAESLRAVINALPVESVSKHAAPLVDRLAKGEWFTSKISAANIIAPVYARGAAGNRGDLRKTFVSLCEDESPMVRRAASVNLSKFAHVLEREHLDSTLMPTFLKLAEDDQDSVRLLAVENCVTIAKLLESATAAAQSVLGTFKTCALAKSWRVRYMVADNIVAMCESLDQALVQEEMTPVFCRLLFKESEPEAEVRTAAARKVTAFAKLVPLQTTLDSLVPAVIALAVDASQHVRSALASVVMGLAPICGPEHTNEKLLPLYLQLLRDEIPEVRLNIISNIEDVNSVVGIETLSQSLLPAVVELASDRQWRVRLAIIEHIPVLAEQMGVDVFDAKLAELCFGWLGDCVFTVREAAINNIKRLVVSFGIDWAQKAVVPKIVALKEHTNYLYRMTCLYAIRSLADSLGSEVVRGSLLEVAVALTQDPVPNIRFNACKTLGAIVPVVGVSSESVAAHIKPALSRAVEDADQDVQRFGRLALDLVEAS